MSEQALLDRITELERIVRELSDKVGRLSDRPLPQPQNPNPQIPMPYYEPRWDQPVIYGPMRRDYEVWSTSHTSDDIKGIFDPNQVGNNRERS